MLFWQGCDLSCICCTSSWSMTVGTGIDAKENTNLSNKSLLQWTNKSQSIFNKENYHLSNKCLLPFHPYTKLCLVHVVLINCSSKPNNITDPDELTAWVLKVIIADQIARNTSQPWFAETCYISCMSLVLGNKCSKSGRWVCSFLEMVCQHSCVLWTLMCNIPKWRE